MAWTTPKTDWASTDTFNITDFNRIKNNLNYLHDESESMFGEQYPIIDMGSDLSSYAGFWDVSKFNAIEQNLATINEHLISSDIGSTLTFYENGTFITYGELNRIESATVTLKATIDGWYEGMNILPFRLGNHGYMRA